MKRFTAMPSHGRKDVYAFVNVDEIVAISQPWLDDNGEIAGDVICLHLRGGGKVTVWDNEQNRDLLLPLAGVVDAD